MENSNGNSGFSRGGAKLGIIEIKGEELEPVERREHERSNKDGCPHSTNSGCLLDKPGTFYKPYPSLPSVRSQTNL